MTVDLQLCPKRIQTVHPVQYIRLSEKLDKHYRQTVKYINIPVCGYQHGPSNTILIWFIIKY